MMKQFKKALSILCIIALLVSGIAMAFADEAVEAPAEEAPAAAEAPVEEAPAPQPVEEPAPQPAPEPAPQPEPQPEPEPVREEPAPQPEPEPVREEPAPQPEPEPVQEEPAQQPETEPAQEEPATQPAQEEPVQQPAAEESSNIIEETPASSAGEEDENGLVEIDDGWGYVDPEVINENTPEITDEFKGIRNAEMHVGESLSDTVVFGEELVVTLRGSAYPTVTLKLYTAPGTTLNVKIDGKAVGFTPAESDDPSMNLATYELTNTASRKREITFSTSDTASFRLTAEPKQTEVRNDTPETAEPAPAAEQPEGQTAEQPAETPAEDHTGNNTPAPEPTVELSVKTYDALKVGNSINDTLVGGQKARIQLKCGKNPSVTLTLKANPNDANVQIDGGDVQFTQVSEGTYTCKLENVAFRKFNITIMAKQALSFSVSASANTEAGETADEGETEENTEESAEAPAEESEVETAEGTEEEPAEGTEEETAEGTEEEAAEGTEEEGAEGTEEEGTEEEGAEENTEETTIITETVEVELDVTSTLASRNVAYGETCTEYADLSPVYEKEYTELAVKWYYSPNGAESWIEIEEAEGPEYSFTLGSSNWYYQWRAVAVLTIQKEIVIPAEETNPENEPSSDDDENPPVPEEIPEQETTEEQVEVPEDESSNE